MNELTVTEQFGTELSKNVYCLAQTLSKNFVLISVSLLILSAAGTWFFCHLSAKKKKFLFKRTTPLKFHYIMMAVMVLLAVLQAFHLNGTGSVIFFIVGIVLLLLAIAGLLTFKSLGIFAEILFIWIALPLKELPGIFAFRSDFAQFGTFSPPAQAGVYAGADYVATRMFILEIIAAILTMLLASYYTRRTYLFSHFSAKYFADIVRCPACRIPLVFEGDFCPCCGQDIHHLPRSVMEQEPIIIDQNCRNCGNPLNNGFCSHCADAEGMIGHLADKLKEYADDQRNTRIKRIVGYILVGVIVILPLLLSTPSDYMTKGSSDANNTFVTSLNEVYSDHDLAKDPAWLQTFDQEADALFQVDKRTFYLDPTKLDYTSLYMYINYSEATYDQMLLTEQIQQAVHEEDFEQLESLTGYFNATNDAMLNAVVGTAYLIFDQSENIFTKAETMVIDSLRFYLSFVNPTVLWITFFALAVVLAAVTLILKRKRRKSSVFIKKEIEEAYHDDYPVERHRYLKSRAIEFLAAAIAVILVVSIVGIEALSVKDTEDDFSTSFTDLYITNGINLETWISDVKDPAHLSSKDIRSANAIINTMQNDILIITMTVSESENEDNEQTMELITENTAELKQSLDRFSVCVNSGELPDEDTLQQTRDLLEQGMKYYQQIVIQIAFDSVRNLYDD